MMLTLNTSIRPGKRPRVVWISTEERVTEILQVIQMLCL